ncbi:hypothetical protein DFH07DRAFT_778779 [Mycena maculata]|uniref:Uncharacterized protein n=1 Tax=Mycena maculata TaxID=230809 RepID=A0AAD7ID72_9AGAR|nr:hypothetical protein DFH07DRAFT_778779 [Mycena maculata]
MHLVLRNIAVTRSIGGDRSLRRYDVWTSDSGEMCMEALWSRISMSVGQAHARIRERENKMKESGRLEDAVRVRLIESYDMWKATRGSKDQVGMDPIGVAQEYFGMSSRYPPNLTDAVIVSAGTTPMIPLRPGPAARTKFTTRSNRLPEKKRFSPSQKAWEDKMAKMARFWIFRDLASKGVLVAPRPPTATFGLARPDQRTVRITFRRPAIPGNSPVGRVYGGPAEYADFLSQFSNGNPVLAKGISAQDKIVLRLYWENKEMPLETNAGGGSISRAHIHGVVRSLPSPALDPAYWSHPIDVGPQVGGIKLAPKILVAPPLHRIYSGEFEPVQTRTRKRG